MDISIFNNDERIIINKNSEGISINDFTRNKLLTSLSFAYSISNEQEVLELLDGLILKIKRLSNEEWDSLKYKIPFETYYDADSNVDEVPEDV